MKISDMSIEGLNPLDVERIKKALADDADQQYRRITDAVILMEKFKPQILALRRSGFPWTQIATKLETLTKKSISATTIRTYFEQYKSASGKSRIANKTKKSERELNSEEPNVFAPPAQDNSGAQQQTEMQQSAWSA